MGLAALAATLAVAPLAAEPVPGHGTAPPSVRTTDSPPPAPRSAGPENHGTPSKGGATDEGFADDPPAAPRRPVPPPTAPTAPLLTPPGPADITLSKDGTTIYLVGVIGEGSFLKFAKLARSAKELKRVYLASPGGLTVEGRLLGSMVRKLGIDTYVEYVCASACTQVFAAGKARVAGSRARLGFHQAALRLDDGTELAEEKVFKGARIEGPITADMVIGVGGNAMMRLAYQLAGFTPAFIDRALATPASGMWYPEPDELIAAKVVTRQAEAGEVPPPAGGANRDYALVRKGLLENPAWAALAARDAARFEDYARDAWGLANSGYSLVNASMQARERLLDETQVKLRFAPDDLLDRYLGYYREFAQFERGRDYSECTAKDLGAQANDPALAAFSARDDALAAELIANTTWLPALSDEDARKQIKAAAKPLSRVVDFGSAAESADKRDCRIGLQSFEAVAGLDTRQRIKSFRAMLTLIDLRKGDEGKPAAPPKVAPAEPSTSVAALRPPS